MPSEILINSNAREIRVALIENNQLAELFIEHQDQKGIVGNIYKGIVTKVLPGMQVAFVDMGLDKAGFLCANDIDITEIPESKKKIGQSIKIKILHFTRKKKVPYLTKTQTQDKSNTKFRFRRFWKKVRKLLFRLLKILLGPKALVSQCI